MPKAANIEADAVYYVPVAGGKNNVDSFQVDSNNYPINTHTVPAVTAVDTEALNIPVWRVHQEH